MGLTACEVVYGEGCYGHTSSSISKSNNNSNAQEKQRTCWLAKPIEWHTVMDLHLSDTAHVQQMNVALVTQQHRCQPCSICDSAHEFISSPCSATEDARCGSCSALQCKTTRLFTTPPGDDEWRKSCGFGSAGTCTWYDTCGEGTIRFDCKDESPGYCGVCIFGTFSVGISPTCDQCTQCSHTQYIDDSCQPRQDRVCKNGSERARCCMGVARVMPEKVRGMSSRPLSPRLSWSVSGCVCPVCCRDV